MKVLLIISGGIAAIKSLELVRKLQHFNLDVRCILTKSGEQFVTPLAAETITGQKVYRDLFSLTDENTIGHIELSRDTDLILVAPATANLLAKMRTGFADDLASTTLLATDKPIFVVPAMNVRMWHHEATRENIETLKSRGITILGPEKGNMACGEYGLGRMLEPDVIAHRVKGFFEENFKLKSPNWNKNQKAPSLVGRKAIVTSGPTHEPIDPVRYITNHSSGRQGHAIAKALSNQGAETILISGPTQLADPEGGEVIRIESAKEMLAACKSCLPSDILICAAAVADWRVENPMADKWKKDDSAVSLELIQNTDILMELSKNKVNRPRLVIGFAAETKNIISEAKLKLKKKGCDWIIANNVSPNKGVFGSENNTIHIISKDNVESWPTLPKEVIGEKLSHKVAGFLEHSDG